MGDRILVTGASGFVGQHLVRRLAEQGHEVVALDIKERPPEPFRDLVGNQVRYVSGSILHDDFISTMVFNSPNSYDRIFHLAAIVGVDRYIDPDDPLYLVDVNVNGTRKLLDRARGSDARFVYTSTSEIYGKNSNLPWRETDDRVVGDPSKSRWSYSAMKTVCEHMINMVGESDSRITSTIVRPFNLYGPQQRPDFVIAKFLEQVADGTVPTVYGDGTQKRCFTYIDDFIDGLIRASERDHQGSETYNLGSTDETSIRQLADLVLEVAGMENETPEFIDPEEVHGREYEEPERRIPDVSRAKSNLDWSPSTPLRSGLVEHYEQITERR